MGTFAPRQPRSQKQASSTVARSHSTGFGPTYGANSILPTQRTAGNQAVQRVLQAHDEDFDAGLTALASPRFGHDNGQVPAHPAAAPSLQPVSTRNPAMAQPIQRKPTVSAPDDPFEREAEDVADRVMRMAEPASFESAPATVQRINAKTEDLARKPIQTRRAPSASTEATADTVTAVRATERRGTALSPELRSFFEPRFGHDFGAVRVHADREAASAAHAVQARAFSFGRDIVFGAGEYAPGTTDGRRLLAHELTHVVQQGASPGRGLVMRQRRARRAPARLATVEEAAEFLEDMARFIGGARSFAQSLMRPSHGTQPTAAERRRAHTMLNQQRLRDFLRNARRVFAVQEPALQAGDPHGTRLRAALLLVAARVREAAPDALGISAAMPAPTPGAERRLNAELVADLIETDPFTSAGMLGTPAFGAAETAAGASHEAFIEAYLDDLIRSLPGQTLAPAARDRILARISAGLRRAFLTVGTGPAGTPDIRAISNPRIVGKYRRVIELLSAAMSARPAQLSIITDSLPAYVLPPDPVPDVTPQLQANANIGTVDLSRVPAIELPYIRHGVLQAANTVFAAPSTVQLRNASWPLALLVRRNGNIVRVRYDLIFDATSNVRVERIGEAAPREVAPAFAQLAVPAKKAQLVADFGLAGVDDRPAAPGRAAAVWTSAELDQVKAAYDLIPAGDRAALGGVTLVRDRQGPPMAVAGQVLQGFAHTQASPAHDAPGPPPHGPPHIHYYDAAFAQNAITAVGGPGSSGPGADWTVTHEVGHMRIALASRQGNAAVTAANQLIVAANAGLPALNAALPQAQHLLRVAYGQARNLAGAAIQALNAAVIATPPAIPAQRALLLQAAQAAVVARDQARANLSAAGVPAPMVQAATNLDAAMDALLAATQSLGVAQDQIPTFIALAGTFGFTPFTDYARRGGNAEFFAEAYALFLTDPSRLSAMNRSIFLWFEAGMPMNPGWRPPP